MSTPHNSASAGQIAKTVLFPGDPVRAQYIAKEFLADAEQVTYVRGIPGFTGYWKGKRVSVMASGMGGASAGIYSYELFSFFGVENIIRIGTAGGLQPEINPGDVVFALSASTDCAYARQYSLPGTYSPCADFGLLERAVAAARESSIPFHTGAVFSSDYFSEYNALGSELSWKLWSKAGCLVQDMETYALYCNAAWLGKKALSVLTHTDSCVTGKSVASDARMTSLVPMIQIALEAAV
jgi:purine-nucleoside phosphorylase